MKRSTARGALELGALGVVFGDIGTSPLYTVQTVFSPSDPHPVQVSSRERLRRHLADLLVGDRSIVTVTYVLLVMRADNDGEGGIMALITLIRRRGVPGGAPDRRLMLAALGVFGASLFFGDSMITPGDLGAVRGRGRQGRRAVGRRPGDPDHGGDHRRAVRCCSGSARGAVGRLFGPVMAVWFTVIGACGHPRHRQPTRRS